jgi:dTDP-glucose pyrophosphorylase
MTWCFISYSNFVVFLGDNMFLHIDTDACMKFSVNACYG